MDSASVGTLQSLFGRMALPAEGITMSWLATIKITRTLIVKLKTDYGERVVDDVLQQITSSLEGSARGVWAISTYLETMYDSLQTVEKDLQRLDIPTLPIFSEILDSLSAPTSVLSLQ